MFSINLAILIYFSNDMFNLLDMKLDLIFENRHFNIKASFQSQLINYLELTYKIWITII